MVAKEAKRLPVTSIRRDHGRRAFLLERDDVLNDVARAHGVSGAQVALAWLLQRPAVASVIIGGRTTAQFEDNLKAVDLRLEAEEVARLDKVSLPPLIYPHWHQNWAIRSRMTEDDHAWHDQYPMP